jgi:hypothetical protein
MDEAKLLQKLRDLEALVAGGATPGERSAADSARERILTRLHEVERSDPAIEYRFTLRDVWSQKLFLSLLTRYGLKPYRYRGQRHTTVMVRVPKRFVDQTLWPHFERASAELRKHLAEVASRVIELATETHASEAEVREQEPLALPFTTAGED